MSLDEVKAYQNPLTQAKWIPRFAIFAASTFPRIPMSVAKTIPVPNAGDAPVSPLRFAHSCDIIVSKPSSALIKRDSERPYTHIHRSNPPLGSDQSSKEIFYTKPI